MYSGEVFILRNAAKKIKNIMLKLAKHYDKKQEPSFHKCVMRDQIFIE